MCQRFRKEYGLDSLLQSPVQATVRVLTELDRFSSHCYVQLKTFQVSTVLVLMQSPFVKSNDTSTDTESFCEVKRY